MDWALLWALIIACSVIFYALIRFGEFIVVRARRLGRIRVVWHDPDSGYTDVSFEKIRGNLISWKREGETGSFIVDGRARGFGQYRTVILHPRHGWNLVGLTDREAFSGDGQENRRARNLAVSDPYSYHYAIQHNEARDALEANREDDSMWVKLAPYLLIVSVLSLFVLGFVAWRLGSGVSVAPVAGV